MIFKDDGKYAGLPTAAEHHSEYRAIELPTDYFTRISSRSLGERNTGNLIIEAENLLALQHLQRTLKRTVRCVYLDPPYNNREQYNHYQDDMAHSEWLDAISARLEQLVDLLTDDGSVWISIDDRECHYLKVAADTVFGRRNFMTAIIWQQRTTRENRRAFSVNHEYVLVYAKDAKRFRETRNLLPSTQEQTARYKNPDDDPRGPWQSVSANVQAGHATPTQFYTIVAPNGRRHRPPNGRCWVYSKERMEREIKAGNVWFGRDGNGVPRLKRFAPPNGSGLNPPTLWMADDVGTSDSAKKHLLEMFPRATVFDTPKPEALLAHIMHIATNPGDLLLDPYLGSGTSAAVAHKLRRRYIGIELSREAAGLSSQRLGKVIRGEKGGISQYCDWDRGGGFDYFRMNVRARAK